MIPRFTRVLQQVIESPIGIRLARPARLWIAVNHFGHSWRRIPSWLFTSRERTNFTYDYTEAGNAAAVQLVSLVTGTDPGRIAAYANEVMADIELKQWLSRRVALSPYRYSADTDIRFGRRLLYYLFVRAAKPRLVVEAGTDKGLGACLIASALQRNREEGVYGRLYALDVRENRGFLLGDRFTDVATLRIGNSVDFLSTIDGKIDFFVHDTSSDEKHEAMQYRSLESKLAPKAITVSTWFTAECLQFVQRNRRSLLVFAETPKDHWYPGGRLPVTFVSDRPEAHL